MINNIRTLIVLSLFLGGGVAWFLNSPPTLDIAEPSRPFPTPAHRGLADEERSMANSSTQVKVDSSSQSERPRQPPSKKIMTAVIDQHLNRSKGVQKLPPLEGWDMREMGLIGAHERELKSEMTSFGWTGVQGTNRTFKNKYSESRATWEVQGERIIGVVAQFKGISAGADVMGLSTVLTGSTAWDLPWEKTDLTPVAGVVKAQDGRDIYYFCAYERTEMGPPFTPKECHFQFGAPPPEVASFEALPGSAPLAPLTQTALP
jgi:hypothetical protein